MNNNTIGQRIKNLRIEKGLSVDQIVDQISKNDKQSGISRATYYRYESQNAENQPVKAIKAIAKALGTSEEYLLGLTEDKRSREWAMIENYNAAITNRNEYEKNLKRELSQFIMQIMADDSLKQLLKTCMLLPNINLQYLDFLAILGNGIQREYSEKLSKAEAHLQSLQINSSSIVSAIEVIKDAIDNSTPAVTLSFTVLKNLQANLKSAELYAEQEVAYYNKSLLLIADFLNNLQQKHYQALKEQRND